MVAAAPVCLGAVAVLPVCSGPPRLRLWLWWLWWWLLAPPSGLLVAVQQLCPVGGLPVPFRPSRRPPVLCTRSGLVLLGLLPLPCSQCFLLSVARPLLAPPFVSVSGSSCHGLLKCLPFPRVPVCRAVLLLPPRAVCLPRLRWMLVLAVLVRVLVIFVVCGWLRWRRLRLCLGGRPLPLSCHPPVRRWVSVCFCFGGAWWRLFDRGPRVGFGWRYWLLVLLPPLSRIDALVVCWLLGAVGPTVAGGLFAGLRL